MKAFPMTHPSENTRFLDAGMDLRDYFAAKAMEGFMGSGWSLSNDKEISTRAYQMADAMIKARESK